MIKILLFEDATSFNQDLDDWDVDNVEKMEELPSWYNEEK
jgi:hypothetical protein